MYRTTIKDISELSGVSTASIDRVLNKRSGVKKETKEKVYEALRILNNLASTNLKPIKVIALFIPRMDNPFLDTLLSAIKTTNSNINFKNISLKIIKYKENDQNDIIIKSRLLNKYKNVVLFCSNNDFFTDLVNKLKAQEKIVVTLISDIPQSQRDHFIGVDNTISGQCAGNLFAKHCALKRGKIVGLISSSLQEDHKLRFLGMVDYLKPYKNLEILPALECDNDINSMEEKISAILKTYPDIIGIYNTGAELGASYNVIKSLDIDPSNICFISHEITPITRKLFSLKGLDYTLSQPVKFYAQTLFEYFDDVTPFLATTSILGNIRIHLDANVPIK